MYNQGVDRIYKVYYDLGGQLRRRKALNELFMEYNFDYFDQKGNWIEDINRMDDERVHKNI